MMALPSDSSQVTRLSDLLGDLAYVPSSCDVSVTGISADSRTTGPGDVFFACPGAQLDGRRFVPAAARAGAAAVVVPGEPSVGRYRNGIPMVAVPDIRATLGVAADRYFGAPSRRLRVVGVTGTNGKTSVTHFAAQALATLGDARRPGLIGTLGYGPLDELTDSGLTTPDAVAVHAWLARLESERCTDVMMEVSSHALDQQRVAGVRFSTAVFTNLTRDHLDYHRSMPAYGRAKRSLFERGDAGWAVINIADGYGAALARQSRWGRSRTARVIGYAVEGAGSETDAGEMPAERLLGRVYPGDGGLLRLDVDGTFGRATVDAPLVGVFNAANLLAAIGILVSLDVPFDAACESLANVHPIPGRMERFGGSNGQPLVVVDYSHTPDSLENALRALRPHARGKLWCVFGCGGDRDRGKRPLMGAAAARHADHLIVTDDNPRYEDGDAIVADVLAGVPGDRDVTVERDRGAAVADAVGAATACDVVLVAGKGHETYQEVAGSKRPFSDAAAVRRALEEHA